MLHMTSKQKSHFERIMIGLFVALFLSLVASSLGIPQFFTLAEGFLVAAIEMLLGGE